MEEQVALCPLPCMDPCPTTPCSFLCAVLQPGLILLGLGTFLCPACLQSLKESCFVTDSGLQWVVSSVQALEWLGFRAVWLMGCRGPCGFQSSGCWNQSLTERKPRPSPGSRGVRPSPSWMDGQLHSGRWNSP